MTDIIVVTPETIQDQIFTIRGKQVMMDRDLAVLYGVETKRINEQVKRNLERFPERYCFQLSIEEKDELVAKCDRFKLLKHSSSLPYAFTETGVAMLSTLLRSKTAVKICMQIMDAFVEMRRFLRENSEVLIRLDNVEQKHPVIIKQFKNAHDRFLIIDGTSVYHIGASLKDLGTKWFAFSKMEMSALGLLSKL